jgi:hypothetical protein
MADRRRFGDDVRLACQATVNGDATVRRLVVDEEDQVRARRDGGHGPKGVGEERRVAVLSPTCATSPRSPRASCPTT